MSKIGINFKTMITPRMMLLLLAMTCAATAELHLVGQYWPSWPRTETTTMTPPPPPPPQAAGCSDAMTCAECTGGRAMTCHWAAARQACEDGGGTGNLTVSRPADCPTTRTEYDGHTYRVHVANDVAGLLQYMRHTGVYCSRGWAAVVPGQTGRMYVDGQRGHIACPGYPMQPDSPDHPSTVPGSFYITFGPDRVMLRTDDRSEYYASRMYDRKCGSDRAEYCVGCMKMDAEKRFYAQWCPSQGKCVDWMVNDTEPRISDRDLPRPMLVDPVDEESRCDVPIEFKSIQPRTLAWDSDETTVTIELTGHSTLAQNATVRVTVAGQECERPRPVAMDMFSCTVCGPMAPADRLGDVRVDYGPVFNWLRVGGVASGARVRGAVLARKRFRFVGPENVACDPRPLPSPSGGYRGPASGGTMMLVRWTGLGCVDLSAVTEIALYGARRGDGIRHYAMCLFAEDGEMVCRAPPVVGARAPLSPAMVAAAEAAARDRSTGPIGRFRCGFRLRARNGEEVNVPCATGDMYTVYPDPVFTGFNVTRGGQTLYVAGRGLGQGFGPGDVIVRFASGSPGQCSVVAVSRDWMECTAVDRHHGHVLNELQRIWVTVGSMPAVTVVRNDRGSVIGGGGGGQ